MKYRKITFVLLSGLLSLFLINNIYAFDMKNVIAYPVPFNHNKHKYITIGNKNGTTLGTYNKVKITVFDINGDLVFDSEYSATGNVIWNARNGNGKAVKPGMYIIKVTIENTTDGDYGEKKIRILING